MKVRLPDVLVLLQLVVLQFCISSAYAKVRPIAELETLPENAGEQELWVIASNHENTIFNDDRVVRDAKIELYLEGIANRMLGDELQHTGVNIDFFVVQRPTLSAWVYPYGTIAVHTGLIAGLENEAELAAIIAHELSHFLQRHSYRELIAGKQQNVLGKGLGLLLTAAAASQTGVIDTNLMKAGGIWSDLVTSGYSRKLEHAADAEGLVLMQRAGYERDEAIDAFVALKANDAYGVVDVRQLWSSHPKLEDRIDNLTKAVAKEKKAKGFVPGRPVSSQSYYQAVAPVLLLNAKLDIAERQYARARMALAKYLQVQDNDPQAHFLMGESYRLETPDGPQFDSRASAYRAALVADRAYALAHKELGMTLRQLGDSAGARDSLQQYLVLEPEAIDAGIIHWYLESL